ncbi:MAG: peptidylprolyl isomerase [Acidimicrobiales bacterium]|nr:peptidylprolyl isomerase [Acidimicrobiales bacterium]
MGTDKRERQKAGRQARLDAARQQEAAAERRRRATSIGAGLGLVVVVVVAILVVSQRDNTDDTAASTTSTASTIAPGSTDTVPVSFVYGNGPCAPDAGVEAPVRSFTDAPQQCIDPEMQYVATFTTTAGTVKVLLDTERTPGTANNFVTLSRYGYYDDSQIFRADQSIDIIQGGGPTTNSATDPGPGYTIPDEGEGFTYVPGQLVMARSQAPNSASAQFFFTAGPNASALDEAGTYVVFGNVIEGLDIVESILASSTGSGSLGGQPDPTVIVTSVQIEELAPGSVTTTTALVTAAPEDDVALLPDTTPTP